MSTRLNNNGLFGLLLLVVAGCGSDTPRSTQSDPSQTDDQPAVVIKERRDDVPLPIQNQMLAELQQQVEELGGTLRKYSPPTNAGRPPVPGAPPLRSVYVNVNLNGTQVTNEQLATLAQSEAIQQVTSITLNQTQISDEGLAYLVNAKNLEMIDLSNTQVSDRGLDYLRKLPRLDYVILDGSNVSHKAESEFMRQLPSQR